MTTPGPDPVAVGHRIAQARRERGLSQDELADQASFSKRALGNWERGESIPYRRITEIAGLVGRTRNWILYGEDDPTDLRAVLDRLDRIDGAYAQMIEEVAESQRTIERQILRIQQGLELAGIQLPRDVSRPGIP